MALPGLGRERGQVIDVLRPPLPEQRLQQRVAQNAVVEDLLQAVQRFLTTGMLEERRHLNPPPDAGNSVSSDPGLRRGSGRCGNPAGLIAAGAGVGELKWWLYRRRCTVA